MTNGSPVATSILLSLNINFVDDQGNTLLKSLTMMSCTSLIFLAHNIVQCTVSDVSTSSLTQSVFDKAVTERAGTKEKKVTTDTAYIGFQVEKTTYNFFFPTLFEMYFEAQMRNHTWVSRLMAGSALLPTIKRPITAVRSTVTLRPVLKSRHLGKSRFRKMSNLTVLNIFFSFFLFQLLLMMIHTVILKELKKTN